MSIKNNIFKFVVSIFSLVIFLVSSCTSVFATTIAKDSTSSSASKISTKSINYLRNETITFPSVDKLDITADLYLIDKTSPMIVLFHRAKWSRGEYLEIAPRLNELGYNVMAVDARSGNQINGVVNDTAKRANESKLGMAFPDASIDIEASLKYAKETLGYNNIIAWGSSYSAALVLALSKKYPDVKAAIAFSPGEYFKLGNKNIAENAKDLNIPVFITGAKAEEEYYRPIFEAINNKEKICFVPKSDGCHGAQNLWKSSYGNSEYWDALKGFLSSLRLNNEQSLPTVKTIEFPSLDGLEITGNLYLIDKTSPIILLFHRARWSRGEYLELAPKLNKLGYNVMAIDARSGASINGVKNKTTERALEYGVGITFVDAAVDIEATIKYAKEALGYNNIITWGSSYSAALVLAVSKKYPDVKATIAFSPGEYFKLEEKTIAENAKDLNIPVFITGAKEEEEYYRPIFEAINSKEKVLFVPKCDGCHGTQALWESSIGNDEYANAVIAFLKSLNLK